MGDSDPDLHRVAVCPVASRIARAKVHVAMAKAPRIRAAIGFVNEVFIANADPLGRKRPFEMESANGH
ncbi:hypothetical protein [Ostreiculturibacter nitratireducens]|uniref:hypothetical protein n=1 Tax=Ostreiculturibacter nitratireducens TaxID=3075226 RepID=UPI0031B5DE75